MTDCRLYYVQVEEMPSEESAWLTASKLRFAAEIVVGFSIKRTDLQRKSVGQTVLLDLAVTLQMQPVNMTDQALQQLQLSLRWLRQALRQLI